MEFVVAEIVLMHPYVSLKTVVPNLFGPWPLKLKQSLPGTCRHMLHCLPVKLLIIVLIHHYVHKTSENSEKYPLKFPTVQGYVIKCFVTKNPKPKVIQLIIMFDKEKQ